jgi:hypothetical protein
VPAAISRKISVGKKPWGSGLHPPIATAAVSLNNRSVPRWAGQGHFTPLAASPASFDPEKFTFMRECSMNEINDDKRFLENDSDTHAPAANLRGFSFCRETFDVRTMLHAIPSLVIETLTLHCCHCRSRCCPPFQIHAALPPLQAVDAWLPPSSDQSDKS